MIKSKYTKEVLQAAVNKCVTCNDVVRLIRGTSGMVHGGTAGHVRKMIKIHGIDTSHFKGRAWTANINNPLGTAYTKEEFISRFLVENSPFIRTVVLKSKLISFGIKTYQCEVCGIGNTWNGKPLTLQLDHENGNRIDNRIINLKIKCPNCHTQTPTYCGKNKNRKNPVDRGTPS